MKRFRLHFNRINMQRGNPNVWTVHTSKACIQVVNVEVRVPIKTIFRPDGPQPRAYFVGSAFIKVEGDTAYLTAQPREIRARRAKISLAKWL